MRTSLRAAFRLALAGGLALAGLSLAPSVGRAATAPEKTLPPSTFVFVKVDNASQLRKAFSASQMGQLLADPALKPMKDQLSAALEEPNQKLKQAVGVTIPELLELPEGTVVLALVSRDDPKLPFALLLSADAGAKSDTMDDVMNRATKEAEGSGSKVATEDFQGTQLHIIKGQEADAPPLVWAKQGTLFRIGSDVEALKDLISHAEGRDESLASNELFGEVSKRVGDNAQVRWFLDLSQVFRLVTQAATNNGANGEQIAAQLQILGINGLKAIGGSFSFNEGDFDSVSKTFIYSPGPLQGLLKIFQMPAVDLKPQPWVAANVASYQTLSWDLDGAWNAINELLDMFAPGVVDQVQKGLSGPNGEGLEFKRDLFGPLGNRLTLVSDFKKPVTEKSQRLLLGVALDDAKAAQNTLNKIFALANASPKKREFQGTTIYDFDLPPEAAQNSGIAGPISLTIAKNHLFVSSEPSILEQALRSGGPSLADSPEFQALTKHFPTTSSTLSYQRPEEQARMLYNMIQSGQLQEQLKQAQANDPNAPKLDKLLDPKMLPDFSVFEKYLSQGGGYGTMTQDGLMLTRFTLRKANP